MSVKAPLPLRQILAYGGFMLLGLGIALVWRAYRAGPEAPLSVTPFEAATVLDAGPPIAAFALTDQRGRPFTEANFAGRWTFLYFGYTSCPDACPTTLKVLGQMGKHLPLALAAQLRIVFVSVDPKRDTPEKLAKYVDYFGKDMLGVTGDDVALQALTKPLGIHYERHESDGAAYLVDHSANVLGVDPEGRLRMLFSPPFDAAAMAADLVRVAGAKDPGPK